MDISYFYDILNSNIVYYIIIFLIVLFVYLAILKHQIYSVFDPLLLFTIYSAGTTATNILLYKLGYINTYYIFQYIITEVSFVIGLLIVPRINLKKVKNVLVPDNKNYKLQTIMFVLTSIIYIILQLYIYIKVGIPIFYNQTQMSLLDLQSQQAIINRILNGCLPIIIYFEIDNLINFKKMKILYKIYSIFIVIFIIITLILSGWKSSFIIIAFISEYYLMYSYRYKENKNFVIKKIMKFNSIVILLAFVFAIVITSFRYTSNANVNALTYLFRRIASSGDIYIYSYVNPELLLQIDKGNFILNLIGNTIFLKHLFSGYLIGKIKDNLGLQIFQNLLNVNYISGPNPRHNFFGLVYFGLIGSVFYSFIIGYLTSFVRNKIYYKLPSNIYGGLIYSGIAYYIIYAHVDLFSLCIPYMEVFLIVFFVIFLISHIIDRAVE